MSKLIKIIIAASIFLLTTLKAPAHDCPNKFIDTLSFSSSNLPIIVIDTHGKTIPDEPKITADMGIIFNGENKRNYLADFFNNYNGKITIEVRGTSSQMFPKKQYSFDTIDSSGNDLDVKLLGFPSEHSWILSAPYTDKSLIRDALTYELAERMGWYASRSKFCEVVLNGEYMGVYVLFEKVKRGKERVNISKAAVSDTTGDALTGGYILQIDRNEGSQAGWPSGYPPFAGARTRVFFQYNYPKAGDITAAQKSYIQNYLKDFESKMNSKEYADPITGYPLLIDIGSFIDFFIINEMNKNVDEFRLSTYLYKDRDSKGGKLFAGPVWDFNLAYGNANYYKASDAEGWQIDYESFDLSFQSKNDFSPPFWAGKLFNDKNIKQKIAQRWNSLRSGIYRTDSIFNIIDSLSTLLSEAQARNFTRWPILGKWIWPNQYVGNSHNDEITYLKGWIIRRFDWMDRILFPLSTADAGRELPGNFLLEQNYPNPFNPQTRINYSLPRACRVKIIVYNMLGEEITLLVNDNKPAGAHSVIFYGNDLASGIYLYRMEAGEFLSTRKFILLK